MPYEPISISKEVWAVIFSEKLVLGQVGSMPTFFVGELYANFGYLGVIIPPFFIGFFLYGLNLILLKLIITPIFLSFYIQIIIHYTGLSATSLNKYILDTKMFILLFALMFILSIPYNFRLKTFKLTRLKK